MKILTQHQFDELVIFHIYDQLKIKSTQQPIYAELWDYWKYILHSDKVTARMLLCHLLSKFHVFIYENILLAIICFGFKIELGEGIKKNYLHYAIDTISSAVGVNGYTTAMNNIKKYDTSSEILSELKENKSLQLYTAYFQNVPDVIYNYRHYLIWADRTEQLFNQGNTR